MLCASLDGRGVWERMDTCMCRAESLHCSPETITTLLIGYTPIQNILVLIASDLTEPGRRRVGLRPSGCVCMCVRVCMAVVASQHRDRMGIEMQCA